MDIFDDPSAPYLRTGIDGMTPFDKTRHRIELMKTRKLRRIIDSVPSFDRPQLRQHWSFLMASFVGTHVWPDANHRTAITAFDLATERAFRISVALPPAVAEAMMRQSKAMRDDFHDEEGRYFTVEELADPRHPYRRHFRRFERDLIPRGSASQNSLKTVLRRFLRRPEPL